MPNKINLLYTQEMRSDTSSGSSSLNVEFWSVDSYSSLMDLSLRLCGYSYLLYIIDKMSHTCSGQIVETIIAKSQYFVSSRAGQTAITAVYIC